MTCPRCGTDAEPALTVKHVHICAHCGMAVVGDGPWRNALYQDVASLSTSELHALRVASAPLMRPAP